MRDKEPVFIVPMRIFKIEVKSDCNKPIYLDLFGNKKLRSQFENELTGPLTIKSEPISIEIFRRFMKTNIVFFSKIIFYRKGGGEALEQVIEVFRDDGFIADKKQYEIGLELNQYQDEKVVLNFNDFVTANTYFRFKVYPGITHITFYFHTGNDILRDMYKNHLEKKQ